MSGIQVTEIQRLLLPGARPGSGKVTVITGPTASGKSALAIDMALRRGLHIINADSRQVYHGIPIVTAMPTAEELAAVPHHLIDFLPLEAYYSAARFEEDSLRVARSEIERCGEALLCGGSMMYVDAFCHGIDLLPEVPSHIREATYADWQRLGDVWALDQLARLDPEYRAIVDPANMKRVVHALEIIRTSGTTFTSLRTGTRSHRDFDIELIWIEMPRELLFSRINTRVDAMVAAGLEEEAKSVYARRGLNSLNTVGLKEMFAWFDGSMDRATAIERIKKNTRVYAKKQITWHRRRLESLKAES
ncbi:MAG: tRNA (adenosine(37)-N6)-dimethylallyltransferase MiaA [Muribaculaceae bacterium]|nr:tRNA (adenosine(37)-N6)-dimethylallyltransferase MiaA [Muribaculaceae bacterium]